MTNFMFDQKDKKFFDGEEYAVGKREIARYEQFFPSHSAFKTYTTDTLGLVWESVNVAKLMISAFDIKQYWKWRKCG